MTIWSQIREFREATNGSWNTIDPEGRLAEAAGFDYFINGFLPAWQDPAATIRREAVLYGRRDKRTAGHDAQDLDTVARWLDFRHGTGWKAPEDDRKQEFAAWIAEEATPAQVKIFAEFRDGKINFTPHEKIEMPMNVLILFLKRALWDEVLPSKEELRMRYFQKSKEVITEKERQAWKSVLAELGLSGLREK